MKYLEQNTLIFIAESNWENKNIVSRITLCSDEIEERNLYVGQTDSGMKRLIWKHTALVFKRFYCYVSRFVIPPKQERMRKNMTVMLNSTNKQLSRR